MANALANDADLRISGRLVTGGTSAGASISLSGGSVRIPTFGAALGVDWWF